MKRILFGLSLLAVLLVMATTAFAAEGGFHWKPWKIIVGPADHYVWQPFNQSYIYQKTTKRTSATAFVTQMNDQSLSWIVQMTEYGTDLAKVYQNSPCCYLSYHGYNWPLFTKSRYQNTSKILQYGYHKGWSSHKAYVYQWGDGNYSRIVQSGKDDIAKVSQHGAFNKSKIAQDGRYRNRAYVTQLGDWNYSSILQDNAQNYAKVYQHGFGNVSYICQVGGLGPRSDPTLFGNNTAIVNQLGYMNHSAIKQVGSGVHSAYVTQANFCFKARIPSCAGVGCK